MNDKTKTDKKKLTPKELIELANATMQWHLIVHELEEETGRRQEETRRILEDKIKD